MDSLQTRLQKNSWQTLSKNIKSTSVDFFNQGGLMKKIIIIGPGGSGKSYFAKELHDILNIPLYHLDNLFWNVNKIHISREEFDFKLNQILMKDSYIIDGDYSRTYEIRMQQADTIFFFNFSLEDSLAGASSRVGTKRTDCPFVETEFDPEFKEFLINWQSQTKPFVKELLAKYNNKNIIVFNNRDDKIKYIEELKSHSLN